MRLAKPVPIPEAWTVQLGSFTQKEKADKLIQQLRVKGFTAYRLERRR